MKKRASKKKATTKRYMSDETFAELKGSFEEALAFARGEPNNCRVTQISEATLPPPPPPMTSADVSGLRRRLNYSQAVFARVLNVSVRTVQAWEQGLREPSDAALKLLHVAGTRPDALLG